MFDIGLMKIPRLNTDDPIKSIIEPFLINLKVHEQSSNEDKTPKQVNLPNIFLCVGSF